MYSDPVFWVGVCYGAGIMFAVVTIVAIVVDVIFVDHTVATISRRSITSAIYHPATAALVAGILCLIVGMLLGHLYFGQAVPYTP